MNDMDKKEMIQKFYKFRAMPVEAQLNRKHIITRLFIDFWDSKPTIDEFGEALRGIVLFPEISYYMATHPFQNESSEEPSPRMTNAAHSEPRNIGDKNDKLWKL